MAALFGSNTPKSSALQALENNIKEMREVGDASGDEVNWGKASAALTSANENILKYLMERFTAMSDEAFAQIESLKASSGSEKGELTQKIAKLESTLQQQKDFVKSSAALLEQVSGQITKLQLKK